MQQALFDTTITYQSGQRHKHDAYQTDYRLTHTLLRHVPIWGIVAEPCAGNGMIRDVLTTQSSIRRVITSDIDPRYNQLDHRCDATLPTARVYRHRPNWIVTNPPFKLAHEVLSASWQACTVGVALLLRITFQEPTEDRRELLRDLAPHASQPIVFNPRPRFRTDAKGSDSATCAWFVWTKNPALRLAEPVYAFNWQSEPLMPTDLSAEPVILA